jgi:hypothetical protein
LRRSATSGDGQGRGHHVRDDRLGQQALGAELSLSCAAAQPDCTGDRHSLEHNQHCRAGWQVPGGEFAGSAVKARPTAEVQQPQQTAAKQTSTSISGSIIAMAPLLDRCCTALSIRLEVRVASRMRSRHPAAFNRLRDNARSGITNNKAAGGKAGAILSSPCATASGRGAGPGQRQSAAAVLDQAKRD